jgi:Mg-chelatase subunit ChlD
VPQLPDELAFTDEDRLDYTVTLEGPAEAPAGYPVAWASEFDKLKVDPAGRGALAPPARAGAVKGERRLTLTPQFDPREAKETTALAVEAVYRGRRLRLAAPVTLYKRPDLTALRHEPPRGALVAVQAPEAVFRRLAGNVEIVLVLDCSGSMALDVDGTRRIDRVRDALREALRQLPRGVMVSLYAFSSKEHPTGLYPVFERETLNPDDNPDQVNELMAAARKLTPFGATPLVDSILEARRKFSGGADVSKTLVVLTDGIDTRFAGKTEDIPKVIEEGFQGSRVQLNVLAVDVDIDRDPELDTPAIKDKARRVLAGFKEGVKRALGSYVDVSSPKLAAPLAESLARPRYYVFQGSGKVADGAVPLGGADLSRLRENPMWLSGLGKGSFRVLVQTSPWYRAAEQLVYVDDGDVALLDLEETPDGLRLRRRPYLESEPIKRDHLRGAVETVEARRKWTAGFVEDQAVFDASSVRRLDTLRLTAVLEPDPGKPDRADALKLNPPDLAWFFVRARDRAGAVSRTPVSGQRFYPLYGYPAPAYALEVPDWPQKNGVKARPVVDAYWLDPDVRRLPFAVPLARGDLDTVPRVCAASYAENEREEQLVLEAVEFQERLVEVAPGERQKRSCLVVRLRFPPGKPFFVLPQMPSGGGGFEHRLYLEAGKYVGVFWGPGLERRDSLSELDLVSLKRFQAAAVSRENWELPVPDRKPPPDRPRAR